MARPTATPLQLLLLFNLFLLTLSALDDDPKKSERKQAQLPACAACSALAKSFSAGLERTSRGKFEGGDMAWEEKNQGRGYQRSEVRLVEIQEQLCKDLERGEAQCHDNHERWEEQIEEWWRQGGGGQSADDLRKWLCEDRLKVCCPDDRFGPDCAPCSALGPNGKLCSGNGKCKGAGTRKGSGKCACDKGYAGPECAACAAAAGFYESYRDEEKVLCSPCHKSCAAQCTGAGPKACAACRKGYAMDTEHGCRDVDECVEEKASCPRSKFCVNTEGSHRCQACDKACDGCDGDGPDSCHECANGYTRSSKDGNVCITEKAAGKIFTVTNTRFFTYGGLCIATAIIFQRSTWVAGALGLVVAAYITASEYFLSGTTGELRPISR